MLKAALRRKLKAHVKAGGIIGYATASCFGLGCDPENQKAIRQLLRIKQRPWHKGLIIVGHNLTVLKPFIVKLNDDEIRKTQQVWPGAHTLLISASRKVSRLVKGRHNKVAVRIDAHPDTVNVCSALNGAMISTSLNLSGKLPIKTYRSALHLFGNKLLVLPGRIGKSKTPSTIQDFITGRIFRK
jgi:L-threonylcarbamoyladenylate synthase